MKAKVICRVADRIVTDFFTVEKYYNDIGNKVVNYRRSLNEKVSYYGRLRVCR
jgi:hypothetical protein